MSKDTKDIIPQPFSEDSEYLYYLKNHEFQVLKKVHLSTFFHDLN